MVIVFQADAGELWKNLGTYDKWWQVAAAVVIVAMIVGYAYYRSWMGDRKNQRGTEHEEEKEDRGVANSVLQDQLKYEREERRRAQENERKAIEERNVATGELSKIQSIYNSAPALLARAAELQAEEKSKKEVAPKRGRVLVVEDQKDSRDMLCLRLMRMGYEVAEAEDGEEALERCATARQGEPFYAILTDEHMPKKSGQEFVEGLRQSEDWTPVIFMTAAPRDVNLVRMAELGVSDVLPKTEDARTPGSMTLEGALGRIIR